MMSQSPLTRRDFLKLGGYGVMGMLLPNDLFTRPAQDEFFNLQGRVIDRTIWSYAAPDFNADRGNLYWHNDFGRPLSHGCINLTPQAAKWLYRWTTPAVAPKKELVYGTVGTQVEINV